MWIIRPIFHHNDDLIKVLCLYVTTSQRLNTCFVSICDPRMRRFFLAKNATFEKCPSLMFHQARQSLHATKSISNLLNKDNFPVTCAHENYSIDGPTWNMLVSSSSYSIGSSTLHSSIVGFNWWKKVIRRGMITFTSYLIMKQIVFPQPTYFSQHENCWILDPTLQQTCYELNLKHKLSKKLGKVSTFSQLLVACLVTKGGF